MSNIPDKAYQYIVNSRSAINGLWISTGLSMIKSQGLLMIQSTSLIYY
ncbi:hypothetical protein [Limosilactobacillus coleohominis]|nr:hypothetical protein [Limosilactobacillus coleohominis]